MKRHVLFGFALLAASMFGVAFAQSDRGERTDRREGDRAADQKMDFPHQAAAINLAEIELGKLAVQRSQNPDVRRFAQQMIADHQQGEKKLLQAMGKDASLKVQLNDEQRQTFQKLSALQGAEFDRAYIHHMVTDHQKVIDKAERFSKDNSDSKWAKFASDALPDLREHLKMAKQIEDRLQNQGQNRTPQAQPGAVNPQAPRGTAPQAPRNDRTVPR